MSRADRRAQERAARAAPRQRRQSAPLASNPVAMLYIKQNAAANLKALQTDAGIHAMMGGNWATTVNTAGRWLYIVSGAAMACGLDLDSPKADLRIIMGAASAIGDVHQVPASFEQNRVAIIRGLEAAQVLAERLPIEAMILATLDLQRKLDSPAGLTLHDFYKGVL